MKKILYLLLLLSVHANAQRVYTLNYDTVKVINGAFKVTKQPIRVTGSQRIVAIDSITGEYKYISSSNIAGSSYIFNSGLTNTGGTVSLGGNLLQAANINTNTKSFVIADFSNNSGQFQITPTSAYLAYSNFGFQESDISFTNSAMFVNDNINNIGFQNGGDYEANFTARSLATVQYGNAHWGGGGGSVTSVFGRTGVITAQSGDYSGFYYPLTGNPSGFLMGITSSQITTALGFTPENVANKATGFGTLNNTLYPTTQAVANYVSGFGYGVGTVTNVSGVAANGFTWSIANPSTTPALTLTLQNASTSLSGQLTSTDWNTFNGKQAALGFTPEDVANKANTFGTINSVLYPTTLAVSNYITAQGYVTPTSTTVFTNKDLTSGTNTFPTFNQNTTGSAATLTTGRTIGITGDLVYTSPSFNGSSNVTAVGTLATVNSNVGSFGSSTSIPSFTVNAKGLITAASGNVVIAPAGTLTGTTLASNVVTSSLTSAAGGTFGTNAFNSTTYEVPLTFSTGLTRSTNTITVNTSQNITNLTNLNTAGVVKTTGTGGALSIATAGTDYQAPITLTTTGSGAATFIANTLNIPTPAGSSGTVTSVSVTPANGVSGSVATATTTPAITLTLGNITPTSINTTHLPANLFQTPAGTLATDSVVVKIGSTQKLGAIAAVTTNFSSSYFNGAGTLASPYGIIYDSTPTSSSLFGVTSGGVFTALGLKAPLISPSFTTPALGVATGTSFNKVTITAPTTSATLTLVTGSSLITAGAFATTLTSTATTNSTLPAGTHTLAAIDVAQTYTAQQSGTTPTTGDNTTKFATTAFVQSSLPISGQTTLVAGTKAVTVTGVTTTSKAFCQRVTPSGVTLTIEYNAVCTSNTVTITADVAAGTINTADGSTMNYFVIL